MTDHSHYIRAVADHLTRSGLPVQSIETGLTDDRRTARIEIERDDNQVTLHWHESHGWEYSDSAYEDDSPEDLFAHVVDPPAIVLSALISESWTARQMLRDTIPDDEESALAAYAEPTGARPGQEFADKDGGTWTYVDIGAPELHLINTTRLHSSAWTREELDDAGGPLRPVRSIRLPERDAADVMPAREAAELEAIAAGHDPGDYVEVTRPEPPQEAGQ